MWPVRWTAAAAVLLLPVAFLVLKPAEAPPVTPPGAAALPIAPPPAPVSPDPEPARTAIQPAETAPPPEGPATVITTPATAATDEEQTLYLTIVGDKVYRVIGPVSGRPPRIDQLPGPVRDQEQLVLTAGGSTPDPPGADVVVADLDQVAPSLAPGERPLGPAPQECPRTLPPGSDQATADGLRRQSGCRYLSSCTADTNECTFFYQGRG